MNRRILATIIVILIVALPVHAQDDTALVSDVAAAYENLAGLQGYAANTSLTQTQRVTSGEGLLGVAFSQTSTQEIDADVVPGDPDASSARVTQAITVDIQDTTSNDNSTELTVDMNLIQLDGQLYVILNSAGTTLFPDESLPGRWINLTETPEQLPGFENLNVENLAQLSSGDFAYINESTVTSISEAEPEMLDGQAMRVFEITLDPAAAGDVLGFADLLNAQDLGLDAEAFLTAFYDAMTVEYRILIGVDDNLPHQVDSTITVDVILGEDLTGGQDISVQLETMSTTTYSAFDEPVEITAPEVEPPPSEDEEAA